MREDWEECCFEDLLDYEQPTNYIVKSTQYNDAYETPVLTAGKSFIKGYTNETEGIFDNLPTIIFDDFTTASQFVNFKFKVKSSAMKILVPTSEQVNMDFAFYAMQVNQIRSDTHKRYWISVYAKKKFLLPPLLEQRAIVAKIEELFSDLDKGIADLKKAQDQLKVYRQAVLKKAFEGELTKEWREQNRFTKNEWKFPPLGKVLIQSKEKHKPENVENLFYVGLEHIGKETGNLTETVGVSEIKTVKNKFKTGQILYGKLRPYLNKVYLAKEPGVCSTDILVFNLENSIIGKFAVQFMLSRQFVNDMSANTNGVNLPRVSTKYVNNYKFPLPPIKEQHQIVQEIESRLSVCDKVEESITESLEKAKALRQSVLKKAFEGTLLSKEEIATCKAAPDYEPASVLLEKIKAEKKKK